MTRWEAYQAATRELDLADRRSTEATSAARTATATGQQELALARAEVAAQRDRLLAAAHRHGQPPPPLEPFPAEQAWGRAHVPEERAAAMAALRHCRQLLTTADAELAGSDGPQHRWWQLALVLAAAIAVLAAGIMLLLLLFGA